jgi:hypothetical protein
MEDECANFDGPYRYHLDSPMFILALIIPKDVPLREIRQVSRLPDQVSRSVPVV